MEQIVAAVDLGASSGRVMLGRVGPDRLELKEVHRFGNDPVRVRGRLQWDVLRLYAAVLEGLRLAARHGAPASIGIDSWAVDHGLLDADGELLGAVVHYRDARTDGLIEASAALVPADELYRVTGLQQLPFNTVYQLLAARTEARFGAARTMLLVPDLLGCWLSGAVGAERTNASTTGLLDVGSGQWAWPLIERFGLPAGLFPPLREPGDRLGPLLPEVAAGTGLPGATELVAVGSHDTASAVVAVPAAGERFGYISCGTWSLVGLELPGPVLSEAGRAANFTNEGGVDGTIRYLRNVMGLWLLQESLRRWTEQDGAVPDLDALLAAAGRAPALACLVDPDDPVFLPPGDMPARIAGACAAAGQPAPQDRGQTVRCILDSLALAYARTLRTAQELSGRAVEAVHLVGGGARNELLCRLTAEACGLPVLAGPVEATALGNVLVQARALGAGPGTLRGMRALVAATDPPRRYPPGSGRAWAEAESRVAWRR
jgi:rhamnulokinase